MYVILWEQDHLDHLKKPILIKSTLKNSIRKPFVNFTMKMKDAKLWNWLNV